MASLKTLISGKSLRLCSEKAQILQLRFLSLLEYQSKALLEKSLVNVQRFMVVDNVGDAEKVEKSLKAEGYVIKAQILAGGRGLGHFDNGLQGGVHITKDPTAIGPIVSSMIGHRLITKQTPKEGIMVNKVLIAEEVTIIKEKYICFVMDRESNGPVLIASPAGGTDIEEVAKKTPELIKKFAIDIFEGVPDSLAEKVAEFVEFRGNVKKKAVRELKHLWGFFKKYDAIQLEINPLAETVNGHVVSIDAKIQFDDNAKFRHKEIFALEDKTERDPREVEAEKYDLNYITMTGNIGCMVNGAGLAMATMDIIKLYGGEPANFLDVGGNVTEQQVTRAFKLLTSDKNVRAILVNVFGGIVNCTTIANGIVAACNDIKLEIPLVVRLEGTNVTEAKNILSSSGLPIQPVANLDEAAKKVVSCLK